MTRMGRELVTKSGRQLKIGTGTGTSWKLKKMKRQQEGEKDVILDELVDQLLMCFEYGFYHIDTAEVYMTHPEIGKAIKKSDIKREDFFITSKFNGGIEGAPRMSRDPTEALDKILKELETDYVDLFLVHQPFFDEDDSDLTIESVWKQMVEIKKRGTARYIGVSNFAVPHLQKIYDQFDEEDYPVINQIEFHPYLQDQSPGIRDFCQKHKIFVEAYSPLSPIVGFKETQNPSANILQEFLSVCEEKYNKTKAQILLRYCIQKSIIPITTSSKPQRLKESLDAYDFEISDEDMKGLDKAGQSFFFRSFFGGAYDKLY